MMSSDWLKEDDIMITTLSSNAFLVQTPCILCSFASITKEKSISTKNTYFLDAKYKYDNQNQVPQPFICAFLF